MILPFPSKPEDWLTIWQTTKTMRLLTGERTPITVTIGEAEPSYNDENGDLIAILVTVLDGEFYICFGDIPEPLGNKLVYQINCRDPKKGRWQIPQWYIDKQREVERDKS